MSGKDIRHYRNYIDGQWVDGSEGGTFDSENPATGGVSATVAQGTTADIDQAVRAARRAFDQGAWPNMLPTQRARLLRELAELVERDAERIALHESLDNGKLLAEQRWQWVNWMPELLYYWAGMADKIDGRFINEPWPYPTDDLALPKAVAYTVREPVGVVAAIMPWNSPGAQLLFKFAPAIAAGCTLVAKPSEHSPVSALEFAKLVHEAGFPPGVFNVVASNDRSLGAHLTRHDAIDKISFTGSTETGKAIVRTAAENMTRVTCELGGKSASIVFADADLDKTVKGVMAGVFAASGQTCMAGSRVLVERSIYDRFADALCEGAAGLKVGSPQDPESNMGPIANRPNYEKVMSYLQIAQDEGATIAFGGDKPDGLDGYYVQPTVLTNVHNGMRVAREEVFGPVVSLIPFDTEEEAIAIANDTDYGLAGAVFTETLSKAHRVIRQIRAGSCWINAYRLMTHLVPFGGFKQSGWGHEGGPEGLEAFLNTKAVWIPIEEK